ncbi:interleukin-13 receptor subunit alpha-2-like [Myripristis murdjan]|uniref:interleukin-13 receptor subunit alpha-2-like n=1 Tax=Myripristis murdjan TaxID=586833 RepID=UPI001175F4ED|nr:interleukin-13 receptor subunit alpha-2-like [Myripristis murdjan]
MTLALREFFPLVTCTVLMVAVQCGADRLPPPRQLSYRWNNPFNLRLYWDTPNLTGVCPFKYEVHSSLETEKMADNFYNTCVTTENMGSDGLTFTVKTVAKEEKSSCESSTPLNITIDPKGKLVTDFECLFYSKRAMNCSWTPKNPSLDLEVFYGWCKNENKNKTLSACEHLYSEGTRRGCRLIIEHLTNDVCILLRGTLNGLSVENTFKRRPTYHVKAPPPKLTVTEEGDKLKLSWTAPDVGLKENSWSYSINYSKCGSLQNHTVDGYSLDVPYDKRCRYTFQIMGNIKRDYGKGESLISEAVTHGVDDWSLTVAIILIPAILSICVILSCYCLRRHRAIICPIVPDPSVIFKEMMMNRSREPKTTKNLYIPVPEVVESCNIALVAEAAPPQQNS